jgi:RNA-directed DNA polymerase
MSKDGRGWNSSLSEKPVRSRLACRRMRIADRSIRKLIRLWLQTPVVEAPQGRGGTPRYSRMRKGTPQGGVISPLLANLYLHWFDQAFHWASGPARWAQAHLVRYADDCAPRAQRAEEGPMCATA